jgi:hypothetical protein
MLLARVAGFIQDMMRFTRGQALVPHVNGKAGQLAQFGGQGLRLGRLRALFSGEMDGVADDDADDTKAAGKSRQGTQILAAIMAALQGQHRLRGQAQLVGDSHADAAVANVEGEVARMRCGFQLLAPGF